MRWRVESSTSAITRMECSGSSAAPTALATAGSVMATRPLATRASPWRTRRCAEVLSASTATGRSAQAGWTPRTSVRASPRRMPSRKATMCAEVKPLASSWLIVSSWARWWSS